MALAAQVRGILPPALRAALRRVYDQVYCRNLPGKVTLGTADHWTVLVGPLNADSVVYSGGVGKDITFELALIARIGCTIHLFDPSDTGLATMARRENQSAKICFHPLGLAATSGMFGFAAPFNPAEGSFFLSDKVTEGDTYFRCESLKDAMLRLGHTKIDLLKIDIEGSEYGVIDQIYRSHIDIDQICVEFHPKLYGRRGSEHQRAFSQLKKLGYAMIHRERNDYTFARRPVLSAVN